MLTAFPTAYPDELLYSVLARTQYRKKYPNQRMFIKEAFGTTSITAVVDLPSHLDALVSMLPPGSESTADQLIDQTTLLPFYRLFLPEERVQRVRADMRGTNGKGIYSLVGLTASCVPLVQLLRYCPHCLVDDRARWGECYWHRVHQLEVVHVCPIHAAPLYQSSVPTRSNRTRYKFVSAEEAILEGVPRQSPVACTDEIHELLSTIAKEALWLLNHSELEATPQEIRQRYLHLLVERNLASTINKIRTLELLKAFTSLYSSQILSILHCNLDVQSNDNWLLRLVRKPNASQHPVQHMLIIHLLGHSLETFFRYTPPIAIPFGEPPWPCLNPICKHYKLPVIQECGITYSRSANRLPIGTFTCSCGFSYARTGPDHHYEDQLRRDRIMQFGDVWQDYLRTHWGNRHLSLRQISRELGVDPATVKLQAQRLDLSSPQLPGSDVLPTQQPKNLLAQQINNLDTPKNIERRNEYRNTWLQAQADNPECGVKVLRYKVEPRAYMWLYRNDNEWLKTNRPLQQQTMTHRTRVNWDERDIQLSKNVQAAAVYLRNVAGKPKQITLAAIGKQIGRLSILEKHLSRLPTTQRTVENVVENRVSFALRRIDWAVENYRQQHIFPQRWVLIKRAGIERIQHEPEVMVALEHASAVLSQFQ